MKIIGYSKFSGGETTIKPQKNDMCAIVYIDKGERLAELKFTDEEYNSAPDEVETKFLNLTPHNITLTGGNVIEKSGTVAGIEEKNGEWENGVRKDKLGKVTNLPIERIGIKVIVSMPTLLAHRMAGGRRKDLVCPITRGEGVVKHPEKGFIVSVPGFRTF